MTRYFSPLGERHTLGPPPVSQHLPAVVKVEHAAPSSTSLSKAKFLAHHAQHLEAYCGEEVVAGTLTAPTGLGAHLAMFMVLSVPLAFLAA